MKNTLPGIIFILMLAAGCGGEKYTEYRVYPQPETLEISPGESSFITLVNEIPDGNHIYGNPVGPGTGRPTQAVPSENPLFTFAPARYLPPEKHLYEGETDHTWVYKRKAHVFLPLTARPDAPAGKTNVSVRYSALLCSSTTCIPVDRDIDIPVIILPRGSEHAAADPDLLALFNESSPPGVIHETPADKKDTRALTDKAPASLEGITFSPRCLEESGITGLLQAILFGILAGIILNFMPCVLPVVSLKVMSLVRHAGKDRRELTLLGLLFSAGILASFLVLAFMAAFFGYNWGGLFQHRLFLVIMTGIVFALALSMFGVFTINMPAFAGRASHERENPRADAFMKGLLATLLATPCSGPFLGGTLAWALARPPLIIFAIFMSVGTGMALPYLVLTVNPKLLRFIPRPGEWMKTFEQVMGFLLVFTVLYLLSILENNAILPALAFLCFLSLGLWQYGRFGSLDRPRPHRLSAAVILVALTAAGYMISFRVLFSQDNTASIQKSEFTASRLIENRGRGVISMIKFTADWCPNCRFVEKVSLETGKVRQAVEEKNIDFMVADITRKNPDAEYMLRSLGSYSIPVLAVVPAGKDFTKPLCLRDIYSEDDVLHAIDIASGAKEE